MDNLEQKISKIKSELAMSSYLTGWEIIHYKTMLEDLEFKLNVVRKAFIPTQLKF